MISAFRIIFAVALLCLITVASKAEEIIWNQPASMPARHQNHHFRGNTVLHRVDVRKLQRALAARGFYKSRVDGKWGGKTTQAVLDYQSVHQQPLTGTVTGETLHDLGVHVDERRYR
jgi:peptidoglycan hydrolase-like protein with peptidoglycan-binding domain